MTSCGYEKAGCLARVQTWLQLAARHTIPDSQDHSRTAERVEGPCEPSSFTSLAIEWLCDTRQVLDERQETFVQGVEWGAQSCFVNIGNSPSQPGARLKPDRDEVRH